MSLLSVSAVVGLVVFAGVVSTIPVCFDRRSLRQARRTLDEALFDAAPYLGLVALVLLFRRFVHDESVQLSHEVGRNITDTLFAVEGFFVAHLQALTPDALVPVFAAFYVFGFTYLLVVPVVLYALASTTRSLKELLVAYALNDVIGMSLYTLFVAYGPRLHIANRVDGLLYDLYPQVRQLTTAVSANTNVFPSLHTSLSVVVLVFAWRTRENQPRWFAIAAICAGAIVLSTMVLGIHWLTDVVAGVCLAYVCVVLAGWIVAAVERRRLNGESAPTHASQGADD
ncbi:phosphatase PAP2 family protein [Halapricum salinum]|uniref:Phosphatase PAP2 family protein n=1 Tax=Halapricum salinum TaxID=1457250 RepID=A0A4D6HBB9_9EURY|nr:phosphatase PAP2 family protein [Halapricum salinum]QCC51110.1 phosphatase PAP2 family protein [Halapricum salinum]